MKVQIESTTKIVELNGVPARVWEGHTESGIPVHCFVTRVAIDAGDEAANEQFRHELAEQRTPSAAFESFPARLIL